jgi:serine protease Do
MNRQRLWSHRKLLGLALASGLAIGAFGAARANRNVGPANPTPSLRLADPNEGPSRNSFAPIVKKALPAVVNISSSKVVKMPTGFQGQMPQLPDDPMFRRFFGDNNPFGQQRGHGGSRQPREQREHSLGSGVIVSPEGYILTNNHVVDGATDVKVALGDKREFQARIVGADPKSDIAVLKIDADHLSYITIADSSKVQVGDQVLAIGNPFGVGQTVTMGIVSAMERGGLGIEDYEDFIQTDAPINPGNSGGALVNDRGELIGINTAILAHGSEGNQGIGFAVPANLARQVMSELVQNGKVVRAYIGVMIQDLTPTMAKAFGTSDTHGALVGDVTPGSPAEHAGLQKGDIIREVDGKPVDTGNQLRNRISMQAPDTEVKLKVDRNGSVKTFTVKLSEYPAKEERASNESNSENTSQDITVENLTPETARELHLSPRTKGVVVTGVNPGSKAAEAGLRKGDVIQEVNRRPVENEDQFEAAMHKSGDNALLLVNRQGNTLFVAA